MMVHSLSVLVLVQLTALLTQATAFHLAPVLVKGGTRSYSVCNNRHGIVCYSNTAGDAAAGAAATPAEIECASPDDVRASLRDPRAVILDARNWDEIEKSGGAYLRPRLLGQRWMQVSGCTPDGAPLLKLAAKDMLPDPTVPVLVYCASGKRAAQVQRTLKDRGYANVLNLGGYKDLDYLDE